MKIGDMVEYHPVIHADSVGQHKLLKVEWIRGWKYAVATLEGVDGPVDVRCIRPAKK
jgi:hypothetical protein